MSGPRAAHDGPETPTLSHGRPKDPAVVVGLRDTAGRALLRAERLERLVRLARLGWGTCLACCGCGDDDGHHADGETLACGTCWEREAEELVGPR